MYASFTDSAPAFCPKSGTYKVYPLDDASTTNWFQAFSPCFFEILPVTYNAINSTSRSYPSPPGVTINVIDFGSFNGEFERRSVSALLSNQSQQDPAVQASPSSSRTSSTLILFSTKLCSLRLTTFVSHLTSFECQMISTTNWQTSLKALPIAPAPRPRCSCMHCRTETCSPWTFSTTRVSTGQKPTFAPSTAKVALGLARQLP